MDKTGDIQLRLDATCFVRLRVEKRLFSALQDKDSKTGEVVAILVVNPHETANHAMMNIVH